MEFDELFDFVKEEHSKLMKHYHFKDNSAATLPMTVKIMEELGELSNEVLAHRSLQRGSKLGGCENKISDEFADVLLTTLLLAENMGIDVRKGLRNKIEKIKKRNY